MPDCATCTYAGTLFAVPACCALELSSAATLAAAAAVLLICGRTTMPAVAGLTAGRGAADGGQTGASTPATGFASWPDAAAAYVIGWEVGGCAQGRGA
jgi:hypothetical protein